MTAALVRRGLNDVLRVPGATVPTILTPTILVLAVTALFGNLAELPGFATEDYLTFLVPFGLLQAAAITGGATGVNLARDIENGFFDRLLASPVPRTALLASTVLSAAVRVMMPAGLLLVVCFSLGATFPGIDGLLLAIAMCAGFALVGASWGSLVALAAGTQSAGPLMQAPLILAVLLTTSYAPKDLLAPWMQTVSDWNPVTDILTAARQGFVGDISWASTWPGLVALAVLFAVHFGLALKRMGRVGQAAHT
jgi:ABC-2 type transport system permease protein